MRIKTKEDEFWRTLKEENEKENNKEYCAGRDREEN
jgi:hypothetical protein